MMIEKWRALPPSVKATLILLGYALGGYIFFIAPPLVTLIVLVPICVGAFWVLVYWSCGGRRIAPFFDRKTWPKEVKAASKKARGADVPPA